MKLTKADIDKVRHIEGFPIARDEDIIALSRPPYYTACPNPFIEEFIRENGTSYDEATDDYHREPFAADTKDDKYDKVYHFHPYHTKVPYGVIMQYIRHFTNPGDIVFDGFSGSGMTGIAAIQTHDENGVARNAILADISPFSAFISDVISELPDAKEASIQRINHALELTEQEVSWMFETTHHGPSLLSESPKGTINFVVWSDVLVCPSCAREIVFWKDAVDIESGKIPAKFSCPHCHATLTKRECNHVMETIVHNGSVIEVSRQIPVLINYTFCGKRYEKEPDDADLELLNKVNSLDFPYWYPDNPLPEGDKTTEPINMGYAYVDLFYSKRNLYTLATLCHYLESYYDRYIITKVAFRITKRYSLTYQSGSWGAGGGPTNGTLYIPSLVKELSMLKQLKDAVENTKKVVLNSWKGSVFVSTQSTSDLSNIGDKCVDYIFVDPPFGGNLCYSELNYIWESWLGVLTNPRDEAIINNTQKKGLYEYQELITKCFREMNRILKPDHWITVVFHNSSNAVWNAIQEALLVAGFIVADIRVMDKGKMSFTQITSKGAVKNDLVISAYKPKESFIRRFEQNPGAPEMAWEFVRQHLRNVPVIADANKDGKLDIISERQNYLLFDRMVAWHIMNGVPIPMDAHTFYDGLRQRFLERDGMFFLPDQVTEYDDKRAHMELDVQQMSFLVTDEKNAIAWLNYILAQGPKTYQEIQPLYLQELHQSKQEKMPELLDMLRENFVQDEKGAWYIPDLNNAADLAKVRRKALLKEFYDSCVPGKGKLKVFRMEAIRAGFDECWKQRDFATIVSVGERLPEAALQEDQTLLMYYDNACSRV